MSKCSSALKVLGGIAAATGVATYLSYQHDICEIRERVLACSQIIETKCGQIEYAATGEGPPVLVVHGAGGGYDQGLWIAQRLVGDSFRVIAPSRFGYLRTPLPDNASATAQADAHACLLDALDISKVAIIGASAGAPSTMQFVLRYPDRVSALVLLVPAAYAPLSQSLVQTPASDLVLNVLKSDFTVWLATKVARSQILCLLGVPPAVQATLTPEEQEKLAEMILPVSLRQAGLANDGIVTREETAMRYPLEFIAVPTLVISAADDLWKTYDAAKYTAENIPDAKFIGLESGGHLMIGQEEKVRSEVTEFLKEHAAIS